MNYLEGLARQFIEVKDNKITFTLQDGVIPEVGENGMHPMDMIIVLKAIFESLDNQFPCNENQETIELLDEAYYWQKMRTINRINRGVEGKYEK